MGQIDKSLQIALAQASVRAAATYYSTDNIDLGHVRGKTIPQERGRMQFRVGNAYIGGTSVEFQIICSDTPWTDTAGAGATNVTVLASKGAVLTAALTADTVIWEPEIPADIPKRYLGARAIGVGVFSAGTHDINVVAGPPGRAAF